MFYLTIKSDHPKYILIADSPNFRNAFGFNSMEIINFKEVISKLRYGYATPVQTVKATTLKTMAKYTGEGIDRRIQAFNVGSIEISRKDTGIRVFIPVEEISQLNIKIQW